MRRFFYSTQEPLVNFEIKNKYDFFNVDVNYGKTQTGGFGVSSLATRNKSLEFNPTNLIFDSSSELFLVGYDQNTLDGELFDRTGDIVLYKVKKRIPELDLDTIDTDFGEKGIRRLNVSFQGSTKLEFNERVSSAVQDNSGIIIAGYYIDEEQRTRNLILKLDKQGELDLSFGINGVQNDIVERRTDICDNLILNTFVRDVAIDTSGNTYYCGVVFNFKDEINDGLLFKLDTSGNVVSNFGNKSIEDPSGTGILLVDISGSIHTKSENTEKEFLTKVDICHNALYIAGYVNKTIPERTSQREFFMIQKRNTEGILDTTFGSSTDVSSTTFIAVGRFKRTEESNILRGLNVRDDYIYLGGHSEPYYKDDKSERHITITRLDHSGNIDLSFGMFPESNLKDDFTTEKSAIDYNSPRGIIYDIFPRYIRGELVYNDNGITLFGVNQMMEFDSSGRLYLVCEDTNRTRNEYFVPIYTGAALVARYTPDGRPDITFNPSPGINESNYYYRALFASPRNQYYCDTVSHNIYRKNNAMFISGKQQTQHIEPFYWKVDTSGNSKEFRTTFNVSQTGNPSFTSCLIGNDLYQNGTMKYREKPDIQYWTDKQTPYLNYPSLEGWFYQTKYDLVENRLSSKSLDMSREKRENEFGAVDISAIVVETPFIKNTYWNPIETVYSVDLSRIYVLSRLSTDDIEWNENASSCIGIAVTNSQTGELVVDFNPTPDKCKPGFGVYDASTIFVGEQGSIIPTDIEIDSSAIYISSIRSTDVNAIHFTKLDHSGNILVQKQFEKDGNWNVRKIIKHDGSLNLIGDNDSNIFILNTDLDGGYSGEKTYIPNPASNLFPTEGYTDLNKITVRSVDISGNLYISGELRYSLYNYVFFSIPFSLTSLEVVPDISQNAITDGIYHLFPLSTIKQNVDTSNQIIYSTGGFIDDTLIDSDFMYILGHTYPNINVSSDMGHLVDNIEQVPGTVIETDKDSDYLDNDSLNTIILARMFIDTGEIDASFGNIDPSYSGVMIYDSSSTHLNIHLPSKLHKKDNDIVAAGTIFRKTPYRAFIGKMQEQQKERIIQKRLVSQNQYFNDIELVYSFNYHP